MFVPVPLGDDLFLVVTEPALEGQMHNGAPMKNAPTRVARGIVVDRVFLEAYLFGRRPSIDPTPADGVAWVT